MPGIVPFTRSNAPVPEIHLRPFAIHPHCGCGLGLASGHGEADGLDQYCFTLGDLRPGTVQCGLIWRCSAVFSDRCCASPTSHTHIPETAAAHARDADTSGDVSLHLEPIWKVSTQSSSAPASSAVRSPTTWRAWAARRCWCSNAHRSGPAP